MKTNTNKQSMHTELLPDKYTAATIARDRLEMFSGIRHLFNVVVYLVIILLFLPIFGPTVKAQESSQITPAEARKIISEGNIRWGKARVKFDKDTFEEMLSSDFYVKIGERDITRKEFIEGISMQMSGFKLLRFDATVLTVQRTQDGWVAIIHEKIERETPQGKDYSLWITKDGWRKEGDKWVITFSEAAGWENWRYGEKPPFQDW